jgi:hypothetical protein
MSQKKMNAEVVKVTDKYLVVAKPTGFNLAYPNVLVTVESNCFGSGIAEGIARMLNEDQCNVCGKFNGLHSEVFHPYASDGGGEVRGHYEKCPNA